MWFELLEILSNENVVEILKTELKFLKKITLIGGWKTIFAEKGKWKILEILNYCTWMHS